MKTYRQRSCPLVRITPPASSSRNLAGRMSLLFSSRRGAWVPRNIGSTPSLNDPAGSTLLHIPPPPPTQPTRVRHSLISKRSNTNV